MTTITLRELEEILTVSQDKPLKNLAYYPDEMNKGLRFLYRLQSHEGSPPSSGMFSINQQNILNTTLLQVSIHDYHKLSQLPYVKPGSVVILTSKKDVLRKFIFKITSIFPFYTSCSEIGGFTYTVFSIIGSHYIPHVSYEEFYVEFGITE
jgi:hypothetical protein